MIWFNVIGLEWQLEVNKYLSLVRFVLGKSFFVIIYFSTFSLRLMSMLLPSLMKVEMCCTLEVMIVSVRSVLSECFLFLFAFLGLNSLESSVSSNRSYNYHKFSV